MPKTPKRYRLSDKCLKQMDAIQEHHALTSATAVIEFAVNITYKEIKPMKNVAKIEAEDNAAWVTYQDGTTAEAHFQADSLDEEMEAQGYVPLDPSDAELVGLDDSEAQALWISPG